MAVGILWDLLAPLTHTPESTGKALPGSLVLDRSEEAIT
jgi:hypothetical protein